MILILLALVFGTGCAPATEHWRAAPEFKIVIPAPVPPRPKTFFERTFPHAEPAWPSNKVDKRGRPPLQVV